MAYTLTIPFFAFRLRLHSGGSFLSPLMDSDVLHANRPLEVLAGKYANAFQSKVLDKGKLLKLMNEGPEGPFTRIASVLIFLLPKMGSAIRPSTWNLTITTPGMNGAVGD